MDTCIPVAEPLPCSPETVTLLIGYTPLKDKKFLKKKDYECQRRDDEANLIPT